MQWEQENYILQIVINTDEKLQICTTKIKSLMSTLQDAGMTYHTSLKWFADHNILFS